MRAGIPVDERGADQGDDGGDDPGSPRVVHIRLPNSQNRICWLELGGRRGTAAGRAGTGNRNEQRRRPPGIRVWPLTWRIMARPNSRQRAEQPCTQMKAPAGSGPGEESPGEAAGVRASRRGPRPSRREPEGAGAGEGVVQRGLRAWHAAKAEGGADHQGHEGDGQAHVVDDGAGHGIGLGGETRASITSCRASRGGAGGDVEHQG